MLSDFVTKNKNIPGGKSLKTRTFPKGSGRASFLSPFRVKTDCIAAIINVYEFIDDFFRSGMSRFMDDPVKKIRLLLKFAMRVLSQLLSDLWAYYASPYPFLPDLRG